MGHSKYILRPKEITKSSIFSHYNPQSAVKLSVFWFGSSSIAAENNEWNLPPTDDGTEQRYAQIVHQVYAQIVHQVLAIVWSCDN